MPKYLTGGLACLLSSFLLIGCSTVSKDIKFRAYNQDKKRVDQVVDEVAVGNWQNAPTAVPVQTKETRKVYFLEFSKEPPTAPNLRYLDEEVNINELDRESTPDSSPIDAQVQAPTQSNTSVRRSAKRQIDIPTFEDDEYYYDEKDVEVSSSGKFVDYTIQKGDTLQKISKKFYNSYSKWNRIYEANKATLKSPDIVSPGMKIKIPVE